MKKSEFDYHELCLLQRSDNKEVFKLRYFCETGVPGVIGWENCVVKMYKWSGPVRAYLLEDNKPLPLIYEGSCTALWYFYLGKPGIQESPLFTIVFDENKDMVLKY
jgi:hypothetical protein